MIKFLKIVNYIITSFLMLLSIFFIVIEGRTLFCGEISIFNNVAGGYVTYSSRFILAILFFVISVISLIYFIRKNNKLSIYVYFFSLTVLISSVIISTYATNFIDILFVVLGNLYFLFLQAYLLLTKTNPFLRS